MDKVYQGCATLLNKIAHISDKTEICAILQIEKITRALGGCEEISFYPGWSVFICKDII